uniref:Uncharacterized protein n=1 Tax=Dicentrarchus labrax TaxID=13489 RepID=A0A8C4DM01_DICLA
MFCGSALCSVFGIDLPEPRRGVLLEMYVQTVLFCREHSFKKEQTSALLSIIKSIHEANIQTPLNNIEQCFKYCKELLLCHSVRRPPFSINLFSSEEVSCILQYIHNSYVRHYKLYKYIFTPQVRNRKLIILHKWFCFDSYFILVKLKYNLERIMIFLVLIFTELKALIEKEVKEQMMLVSGQLDQRMKEIAGQHNRALESPQLNHKAKK